MKPSEIKAGKTYKNKGAGRTTRTVVGIGNEYRPIRWQGTMGKEPDEPGVLFVDSKGRKDNLYLSSFASWAGSESERQ